MYAGKGFRFYPPCPYCDRRLGRAGKFIHGWHIIARLQRHDGRQCDLKIATERRIKLEADEQIAAGIATISFRLPRDRIYGIACPDKACRSDMDWAIFFAMIMYDG